MLTRPFLVGLEAIGSTDLAVLFKHKCAVRLGHPDASGRGLIRVCVIGVGVAGANDFVKNRPYGWLVAG